MKITETVSLSTLTKVLNESYYKPHYDAERKMVGGSVKDWLAKIGVTQENINDAVKKARKLPSHKHLIDIFGEETQGAQQTKNGTFGFTAGNAMTYYIYANGQIRYEGNQLRGREGHGYMGRLKSPKPALVAEDPVASLVKMYDNSFKELAKKSGKHQGSK